MAYSCRTTTYLLLLLLLLRTTYYCVTGHDVVAAGRHARLAGVAGDDVSFEDLLAVELEAVLLRGRVRVRVRVRVRGEG